MVRDPRAYLWDARESADRIMEFVKDRTFEDYLADAMLRAAVERQFEIIGEAFRQMQKADPELARQVPELPKAVALRNILIHGYTATDDGIVWRTIHDNLPQLSKRLTAMIERAGGEQC